MTLSGKTVMIFGLGASGRAAARLALSKGAKVIGVDSRSDAEVPEGVASRLGPLPAGVFNDADLLVVSPGIAKAHPAVREAENAGVEVVGELGFAASFTTVPVIAITGTNGKSTVTSFVGRLLKSCGYSPFVGGNLGIPLSEAMLLSEGSYDVLVLEVSSYQLEAPGALRPAVAAVLNLTPDHLKRHGTMEVYGLTKLRLLELMSSDGIGFLPVDDPWLTSLRESVPISCPVYRFGAGGEVERKGAVIELSWPGVQERLSMAACTLAGGHNLDHVATAVALCVAFGAPAPALERAIGELRALPHRMEPLGTRDDVLWINDSKATNLASAEVGISGLQTSAVVLLGGEAKGRGFDVLVPALTRHPCTICFGGSGAAIHAELAEHGLTASLVSTMKDAVELAVTLAKPGQAILLSPACASFDEFDNFEHRGEVFRGWFKEGVS